ncbi:MAG: restriction endonuclease [Beggiatoa sp. IS2]|nr:MAG: restriction endonuclease [Beggiatoa sp. IS2]
MTLTDNVTKRIISKLINGLDYRIEIVALIDAEFLQYVLDFFKQIVDAKLKNQLITADWYKNEFLNAERPTDEVIINSGLNKKTISNMYNTAKREIALDAAWEHYEVLYQIINDLIENNSEVSILLTIKFRNVSVELNISESLIVINTLAVKRAAIRGGAWSTAGKQVEKLLMKTLCMLFDVPEKHFDQTQLPESMREVDFYLFDATLNEKYRCEVKLMGKGNPEGADVIIARNSKIFVADKLSDLNKRQLSELKTHWVELRSTNGYKRFSNVLEELNIPHRKFDGNIDSKLENIFSILFS